MLDLKLNNIPHIIYYLIKFLFKTERLIPLKNGSTLQLSDKSILCYTFNHDTQQDEENIGWN
jgi:hypothetical protein